MVEGYFDVNWISDSQETKFTSGYIFTLDGVAISWKSTKQMCKSRSTTESEFIALDKAGKEVKWLRNFLENIPLWPKSETTICVYYDCNVAFLVTKNATYNGKSRHIRRRYNTIK